MQPKKNKKTSTDVQKAKSLDVVVNTNSAAGKTKPNKNKSKMSLNNESPEEPPNARLKTPKTPSQKNVKKADKTESVTNNSRREKTEKSVPLFSREAAFALFYLTIFSIAMFTLPFAAFFGVKHLLLEKFHIDGFTNTCWSVFAAVIVVNIIIILYAIQGFKEGERDDAKLKEEKDELRAQQIADRKMTKKNRNQKQTQKKEN